MSMKEKYDCVTGEWAGAGLWCRGRLACITPQLDSRPSYVFIGSYGTQRRPMPAWPAGTTSVVSSKAPWNR